MPTSKTSLVDRPTDGSDEDDGINEDEGNEDELLGDSEDSDAMDEDGFAHV